jgi:hypothetical protein
MKLTKAILPSFLFAASAAIADQPPAPVALASTPPAVQKAVLSRVANGTIEEIDRTDESGEVTFDVAFVDKRGIEQGFTLADDGGLLSVEVQLADAPPAVQKTISAEASGWLLEGIDQNMDDTEASMDIEVSKDGRDKYFTVAGDGDVLSAQVTLDETPPPVQAAIRAQLPGGTLRSIDENFDPGGNTFDVVALTNAGARKSFTVAPNGSLLSQEVPLQDVPPGARQAIQTQIGNGRILRIDQSSTGKKQKGLSYEVEARKDGKSFDFSVGPEGKFLGMDQ